MPRGFSLGLGRKVMDYLTDNEKTASFLSGLSEASGVGHVIPNHQKLLRIGIKGVIQEIENKKGKIVKQDNREATEKIDFYQSSIHALYGVSQYIRNYGKLALYLSKQKYAFNSRQIFNLQKIHTRMEKIAEHKPETLEEAAQLIFSMHCCLHLIGQPVAVGRLDQLLQPFILKIPKDESCIQEVIDCLWIKFGERVVFDSHFAKDVYRQGSCAVPYDSDGNFPHGDCINQWVQQITVGGYKANNAKIPESGCNVITKLCLKASRRLPLNAPCLSLRVNKLTSKEILNEAAKSLLSGGAHPIILQDDRIISSLQKTPTFSGKPISLKDSRDIGCDGCYEPLVVGKSEFAFCYLPLLKVLEQTINHGTNYINAGNGYLSGTPSSFLYKPEAQDIKSLDMVKKLFEKHYEIGVRSSIYNLLRNYGNIGKYCPAPLLSSLIDGCIETGRDIYRGGAEHRFIACMFIGFSDCIDSLYAIQKLCFDPVTACVSLEELRHALLNDWGYDMIPPFSDERTGKDQIEDKSSYYKKLRQRVILFPKFGKDSGRDNKDIKELVDWLANLVVSKFRDVVTSVDPNDAFYQLIEKLKQEYSTTDAPFDIVFTPGSGTFEGYVGWGLGLGASADGRRKGTPISSDFSATPSVQDGPIYASENTLSTLQSWNIDAINEGFSNGAEIDLKIHEDFPEEKLQKVLEDFSRGNDIGGNILTFTCADTETFENAIKFPEKYDLIRVRTGGWSEFFQTFYDAHKQQQMRRPYYSPD